MTNEPPRTYMPAAYKPTPGRPRSRQTAAARERKAERKRELRRARRPGKRILEGRFRRRTLLALYLVFFVVCAAALLTSPVLGVRRVRVQGLAGLTPLEQAAALQAVALPPQTNWLRAPVGEMEAELKQLPALRSAQVSRRLFNTLSVQARPRVPSAILVTPSGRYEVDSGGVPIRALRPQSAGKLPLVCLTRSRTVELGQPLGEVALEESQKIYARFQNSPVVRIAKIEVDQNDNLCLNMGNGFRIRLGALDALDEKLALVERIYARQPDIALQYIAINLSCPLQPACVPRQVAAAQTEGAITME